MKGSHRLAVRTPASHAGNRGSIPRGITKNINPHKDEDSINYSALNASTGFKPAARRAGITPAKRPIMAASASAVIT